VADFELLRLKTLWIKNFNQIVGIHKNNLDQKTLRICQVFSVSYIIVSVGFRIAVSYPHDSTGVQPVQNFAHLCHYVTMSHLNNKKSFYKLRQTAQVDWVEHAQKQKMSQPHHTPVACTRVGLEPA
jgi:hypothetical protein